MSSKYALAKQRRIDAVDRVLSGKKCITHRGGMIYTSKDGEHSLFKEQIIVQKTLTVKSNNSNSLPTSSLLKLIWRIAGYNCLEVKYRSYYKFPDSDFHSYSFDLFFQVGVGLPFISSAALNPLIFRIEQEAVKKLGCVMSDHHHGKKLEADRR